MKVFISHSHTDRSLVRRVSEVLEKAGLEVWDEERQILPGDNWAEKVAQALRQSDAMVVLITPEALNSSFVHREIEYALGEERYSHRLIPVLVGPPKDLDTGKLPWILKQLPTVHVPDANRTESFNEIAEALSSATIDGA